jgi:hypothetical protein
MYECKWVSSTFMTSQMGVSRLYTSSAMKRKGEQLHYTVLDMIMEPPEREQYLVLLASKDRHSRLQRRALAVLYMPEIWDQDP